MNLGLARVYLKHSDPMVAQRTWQHVLDEIVEPALQRSDLFGRPSGFVGVEHYTDLFTDPGFGKTLLVTSHILPELSRICHRVAIITKGRLRALGTLDEIVNDITKEVPLRQALRKRAEIAALMRTRAGVKHVVFPALPVIATTFVSAASRMDRRREFVAWPRRSRAAAPSSCG